MTLNENQPEPTDLLCAGSLGRRISVLARLLEQVLRRRIARHGVVPGQFAQLLALYDEQPLSRRELCRRVCVEQSTMARTLARMERDGLVAYSADPAFARPRHVVLTPYALALRDELLSVADEVNEVAVDGLRPQERLAFAEAIEQLISNLRSRGHLPAGMGGTTQEER